MLADGKADAFATDDILLFGLIARHKAQDKFRVTGDYLSYDPYGIMFRKGEPQLTARGRPHLPQARLQPGPHPALQQMVHRTASDRRTSERADLAAAGGSVQVDGRFSERE